MADDSATRTKFGALPRRLTALGGLIALGTGCTLWVVSGWLAPRDRRVPEVAGIVEVTTPKREGFHPVAAVAPQPAVRGWELLSAEEAGKRLDQDETVLALELNGEARCWPLNVMTGPQREIFNDQLGGRAIAATW